MAAIRAALDLPHGASVAEALRGRMAELGLPSSLRSLGYQPCDMAELAQAAAASHFNLTSRWRPDAADFAQMIARIA